ncbi:MAG: glycosyl hydrolase [Ignavibacteriales bacterium CG18_big_fil_WC_8_21_14_2_50_31_20]|nr:MAG: glycosyl hydrolase [Ignavibacteriales bacterium CG18_big_fil_WC_8_21_14_2_50_31_20]
MKLLKPALILLLIFQTFLFAEDEKKEDKSPWQSKTFSGLKFRSIGPAFTSGRIADFAVNPKNHSEYFVGVASGHIWKTENSGTTWKPVFDNYGSYSIGALKIDENNPNVIWAGTGENNHQRALGYGDGIYKSIDGGESWKNMGLYDSRQIGMIEIDPRNSDIVFVAAEGSVWGPGGDRGLYKTINGGKNWKKVLDISENTGVNNVIIDSNNPDIMYATSEQRRRHVHTKIGGGPESAVYKSTDGGENWRKIMNGLPKVDIGGMGIAVSPVNTDVIYLIVEAADNQSGFYRSTNRGESWSKMSNHSASGQYYNEIYCDPKDVDKVYSVETVSHFTEDGGKTWKPLGRKNRHVDDHAMWIDPADTKHFLIGGDGGVYESFDGGENYLFKNNLPVTQFYRVSVDNEYPFYNVYGGTQDNNSFGGPSRTLRSSGIVNDDWFITNGGDGFWGAADPTDANIVYAEAQYGNMVRYDRKSGESIYIRPEPREDELTYKWNWNTPLAISPHSHTRLYTVANKVFRSDDRGDSWEVISDDITRKLDRNTWKVMDKYWSVDAVVKDVSTSQFGMGVSFDESPVKENLLYVGTDDGLIQVSEDAKTWKKISNFPDVPEFTYVSDIRASKFDENVVFASFDNRKRDDFKPYLLMSNDKGKSWKSIAGNLPDSGTVHTIEQDFINPNLLFAGTEFGLFFTFNNGEKWIQLKSGIPTIAIRDMAIQERESDLVLASFGRGFFVLDDYSPLRELKDSLLEAEAAIFPIKKALMYIEGNSRYGQGATYFEAKNPDFGATFTYYLKEVPKTKIEIRKEKEKKLFKNNEKIYQPTYEELTAEKNELKPHLIFTITDEEGNFVRRITTPAIKGVNRITWDLRYQNLSPTNIKDEKFDPTPKSTSSYPVIPGKYFVSMDLVANGKIKNLVPKCEFYTEALNNTTIPANDRGMLQQFQHKTIEIARVIWGTQEFAEALSKRLELVKQAVYATPTKSLEMFGLANQLSTRVDSILFLFNGEKPKASEEEVPPAEVSINSRLGTLLYTHWRSTSNVTKNQKIAYKILVELIPKIQNELEKICYVELKKLEDEMEKNNAPWTPGRMPKLK